LVQGCARLIARVREKHIPLPSTAHTGQQAAIFIREREPDDRNIRDRCTVLAMRRLPVKSRLPLLTE
jgi:hypothetical protein